MGQDADGEPVSPTKSRTNIHESNLNSRYHDIEDTIRKQSNTALMSDLTCKRSSASRERGLVAGFSSMSNWFWTFRSSGKHAEASDNADGRTSRAKSRSLHVAFQTGSCPYHILYSLGDDQAQPHSPRHRPIGSVRPVQRVTTGLTRVWAKIPFGSRSGDQYITMHQLEFHILTAKELHGRATPPK